jgi:hypothetical protein
MRTDFTLLVHSGQAMRASYANRWFKLQNLVPTTAKLLIGEKIPRTFQLPNEWNFSLAKAVLIGVLFYD